MTTDQDVPPKNPETESTEDTPIVNADDLGSDLPQPSGEALKDSIAEPEKDAPISEKRGRGRPPGSKSKKGGHRISAANAASAEMVVSTLDMMRDAVSAGTCETDIKHRKRILTLWERYFAETGKEPPLWALLAMSSIGYITPAFQTEPAKKKMGGFIVRMQAWVANRRAKKVKSKNE